MFIIRRNYDNELRVKGKIMDKLKGAQRKYLRSQAHHLKPLVIIGAKGMTDQLIGSVDFALKDHELIKVKFGEFKEEKKGISVQIAQATKSEMIGIIGNIAIFYRQNPDPEKRKIKMPKIIS
jgi:RNA-binding protein